MTIRRGLVIKRRMSGFVFAVSRGGGGVRRWQNEAREFSVRVVKGAEIVRSVAC